jgi:hypothetical protein
VSDEDLNPRHLQPFMDGTPLALERIRCAWPALSLADKSYLLTALDGRGSHPNALVYERHCGTLIDIALEDDNAYVRYLAAREVVAPDRDDDDKARARLGKINTDPSPLVRSAQAEVKSISAPFIVDVPGEDPICVAAARIHAKYDGSLFWGADPVYRLAVATPASIHFSVTDLLRYATKELLPNGTVTLAEMADVLLQAIGPDYIQRWAKKQSRGRGSFFDEIKALWDSIPDIPKPLSSILLKSLPEGSKLSPIPSAILGSLDEDQLAWLLWRDDIEMKELRRKLYIESDSEMVRRAAAASVKFELLDSDITRLVPEMNDSKESKEQKVEGLLILADFCQVASLVQMDAVIDFLWRSDAGHQRSLYRKNDDDVQSKRAKRLWKDGAGRPALEKEVLQLQLFGLAKSLSPAQADEDPGQLPDGLKMHQRLVSPDNPWLTYLSLWQAVSPAEWKEVLGGLPANWAPDSPLPE